MKNASDFFLRDYGNTLFPLRMNRLLVEKYSKELRAFIQQNVLAPNGTFQNQHRVFASKSGWFLRRTVKLDPVAEFFLYDIIYRNRASFRKLRHTNREVYGFRIEGGEAVSTLKAYAEFKKSVAKHRETFTYSAYFDVASYFNHIYHHDLVRWFEDIGADSADVSAFGKFLREIVGGRSIDCLPQGLYPAKMVGSAFLSFLEQSNRIRAARSVRLMDDVWLFDNDEKTLISDFLLVQGLLSDRGLSINDKKSAIHERYSPRPDVPVDLDEMKIELLRRRRAELTEGNLYADDDDEIDNPEDLEELSEKEQEYLLSLLKRDTIQEEDAELVLTLMGEHSLDVMEFIPTLVREFPALSKRIYHFCTDIDDKSEITAAILKYLKGNAQVTEYQLFWFGMMAEDYLISTKRAGELLGALYEHKSATVITKAKVLEIPEKRFGLPELREEHLRTGHSDCLLGGRCRVSCPFQRAKESNTKVFPQVISDEPVDWPICGILLLITGMVPGRGSGSSIRRQVKR